MRWQGLLLPFPGVVAFRHRCYALATVIFLACIGLALALLRAPDSRILLVGFVGYIVFAFSAHWFSLASSQKDTLLRKTRNNAPVVESSPAVKGFAVVSLAIGLAAQFVIYGTVWQGVTQIRVLKSAVGRPALVFLDAPSHVKLSLERIDSLRPESRLHFLSEVLNRLSETSNMDLADSLRSALASTYLQATEPLPGEIIAALIKYLAACVPAEEICQQTIQRMIAQPSLGTRTRLLEASLSWKASLVTALLPQERLLQFVEDTKEQDGVRLLGARVLARYQKKLEKRSRDRITRLVQGLYPRIVKGEVLSVSFRPEPGSVAVNSQEALVALCLVNAVYPESVKIQSNLLRGLDAAAAGYVRKQCLRQGDKDIWLGIVINRNQDRALRLEAWGRLDEQRASLNKSEQLRLLGVSWEMLQAEFSDSQFFSHPVLPRVFGALCAVSDSGKRIEELLVQAIRLVPTEVAVAIGEVCVKALTRATDKKNMDKVSDKWKTVAAWAALRRLELWAAKSVASEKDLDFAEVILHLAHIQDGWREALPLLLGLAEKRPEFTASVLGVLVKITRLQNLSEQESQQVLSLMLALLEDPLNKGVSVDSAAGCPTLVGTLDSVLGVKIHSSETLQQIIAYGWKQCTEETISNSCRAYHRVLTCTDPAFWIPLVLQVGSPHSIWLPGAIAAHGKLVSPNLVKVYLRPSSPEERERALSALLALPKEERESVMLKIGYIDADVSDTAVRIGTKTIELTETDRSSSEQVDAAALNLKYGINAEDAKKLAAFSDLRIYGAGGAMPLVIGTSLEGETVFFVAKRGMGVEQLRFPAWAVSAKDKPTRVLGVFDIDRDGHQEIHCVSAQGTCEEAEACNHHFLLEERGYLIGRFIWGP